MNGCLNRTTTNNTKIRVVVGSCKRELTCGSTDSLSVGTTPTECSTRATASGGAQTFFQAKHGNHFDLRKSANQLILHLLEEASNKEPDSIAATEPTL